jgi:hypothetical protein
MTATPSLAYRADSLIDLQSMASAGDRVAARVLGERYQYGDGVPADLKQAASWYERAAFVSPTTSFVYMPGFGKTQGSVIPVTAGQTGPGDPVALNRLGMLYRKGLGVRPDPARAETLLSCTRARGAMTAGDLALRKDDGTYDGKF